MNHHRLWGMRGYLCGAIDRVQDLGIGWRKELTPFLESLGVVVLNPCCKPLEDGNELENRTLRNQLVENEDFDTFGKIMKEIRIIDLRMIDMSDFLFCRIDPDVHMCGTYEEIGWANRMKKPIIIWCNSGRKRLPDWVWGMVPQEFVFDSLDEAKKYLSHIHSDEKVKTLKRWMFFEFEKLVPKISPEESEGQHVIEEK